MAKKEKFTVNLCKINTDAFRHMSEEQLKRAQRKLGFRIAAYAPSAWKKVETKSRKITAILNHYLFNLIGIRKPDLILRPDQEAANQAWYLKIYGKEMPSNQQIRQGYRREADKIERQIWDLQQRAGCSVKPDEGVARDAAREDRRDVASRLRKKAIIR